MLFKNCDCKLYYAVVVRDDDGQPGTRNDKPVGNRLPAFFSCEVNYVYIQASEFVSDVSRIVCVAACSHSSPTSHRLVPRTASQHGFCIYSHCRQFF